MGSVDQFQHILKLGLVLLVALCGCSKSERGATNQIVVRKVNVQDLVKDKSRAPVDQHEVVPMTYYELAAWTGDSSRAPESFEATGAVAPGTNVVCIEVNTGSNRCHIRIAELSFDLSAGEAIALRTNSSATLTCSGQTPASCKAWVIHQPLASEKL